MSGQPPRNMRLAAQPRPAPPIACCSPRALGRKFGRDFNCRWMKAGGQVSARRFLASDKGIYLGMRAAKQQPPLLPEANAIERCDSSSLGSPRRILSAREAAVVASRRRRRINVLKKGSSKKRPAQVALSGKFWEPLAKDKESKAFARRWDCRGWASLSRWARIFPYTPAP